MNRTTEPRTLLPPTLSKSSLLFGAVGLAMSVAGCECEDEGPSINRLRAKIEIAQKVIDFGKVPVGSRREVTVDVSNTGDATLGVCVGRTTGAACAGQARIDPDTAPFDMTFDDVAEDGRWQVASQGTRAFIVSFLPLVEGSFTAKGLVYHDAVDGGIEEIEIRGEGVAPNVSLSATAVDFGDVTVGRKKEVDFTFTNGTPFDQSITIGPLVQDAVVFGFTDDRGESVPFGETLMTKIPGSGTLTIKLWYAPPEEGEHTNTLPVVYCPSDACKPSIALRGRGVKPTFELVPDTLDFGEANVVGVPAFREFAVRASGTSPVTVSGVELDVGTSAEFTLQPQVVFPATIQPGNEVTVLVQYTGASPGRDLGRVLVFTDAYDENRPAGRVGVVQLRAGIGGPDILALPSNVKFGTVQINPPAPVTRNVSIQNIGTTQLDITAIRFNSTTPEIQLTNPPAMPLSIQPGLDQRLTFSYSPTNAGVDTAEVIIESNDNDQPQLLISVEGVGGIPMSCAITVAPTQVTFGLVERGRVAMLPVEIRNGGAQPCSVSNLRLMGGAEFATMSPAAFIVQPGTSQRVEVVYSPTTYGAHRTDLLFDSDDQSQPNVVVPISGQSEMLDIEVVPSQLDFATVPVTCASPKRTVTVYNTGGTAVQIGPAMLDPLTSPEFELLAGPGVASPVSVGAGQSHAFELQYRPQDIGSDSGLLLITTSLSIVPVAVPIVGESQILATVTDEFDQLPTPKADVLFVVDDSCSMQEEQAALGSNLGQFLSYAEAERIDYQIAVTTTDVQYTNPTGPYNGGKKGRFVEYPRTNGTRIITPATPNAAQLFYDMVTALGTNGDVDETGLEAAYLALTDPNLTGWNLGFLRHDAALAIIVVSDEEDYGPRPDVGFYENFFRNIKGFQNSDMFSFSAVINRPGDRATPSCYFTQSDYGRRYAQVVQATGGVMESICTASWGQALANIGLNTFGLRHEFFLSAQPVVSTISVTVNGQNVPSVTRGGVTQWTYDQQGNSVDFTSAATPEANADIQVTYTVMCLH